MAVVELVVKNGVYVIKGGNDERRFLLNCILKLYKLIKVGERIGYVGVAIYRNGVCK